MSVLWEKQEITEQDIHFLKSLRIADKWQNNNERWHEEHRAQSTKPGLFRSHAEALCKSLALGLCSTAIYLIFVGIAYGIRLFAEWVTR
jgi:hypothetical protein